MANEYIRHLTENGVWQFSNVKSVGELYELKTKTKVDIVSSINELHSHYQLNSEGISNIFDTVKDLNEIIGDLDTSLKEEKDKLIDLAKDLADSSSELTSDMKNIKSELEGKLTTADGKIADIYDKAQELQLKFDKDSVIVNGKLTDIEQEIITTKDEVSSKLSKTEFDNAVGVNKWVASFYNMTGDRYATAYPQLEDVSGMTASYVEEMNDSVKLYPFTSPKNGLLHLFTNVRMSAEKTITLNIEHSKGMAVLLNGGYIYYKAGDATGNVSISLRSGWNTIEILLGVHNSVGAMNATSKISDLVGKMTSVIGVGGKDETRLVHNETMIKQTNEKISLKADSTVVSQLGNQVKSNTAQLEVQSGQIATKVSSEEMNKYTGRLSTAETNIIQQSEKIELLATKDEVDTLNGKVSSNSSSITQLNESIAIKASKDELSTVDGKVTSAVGRIDVLQGEVALKASKSELDTVTNNVTQNTSSITAQAGEIALKASKSEVNAVSNRVKNAETSITSNASAIELKASKGELDTLTGRVGSAEASLKVQSDQIASKVGTTELVSYKQDTGTSQDFSVVNKKIKNVGWHRIASNSGNRAFAEFELVDRTSGSQATAIFNAGIMFGRNPTFTLNGFSNYSVNPFPKVRILYKGVYDVVYIDVYINKSPTVEETDTSIYVRKNNQLRGWVDSQLIEATIPEGYTSKEFHIDNSNLVDATSQNTSKDTANVNGVPSATVTDKIVKYETEISQTKEAIELKASKSELYSIKTGSKNLLSLSNDKLFSAHGVNSSTKITKDNYTINIDTKQSTGVDGVKFLSREIDLEPNTEYVFSYKFRVNSGTIEAIGGHTDALFSNWYRLYYDSVLSSSHYNVAQKIPNMNDGNWHSVQYVFKTPSELVAGYIYIQPNRVKTKLDSNVDIKDVQMEKGNIISDWKPSLADSSGETEKVIIDKMEASFKVQADQISSKVSQVEIDKSISDISIGGRNLAIKSGGDYLTKHSYATGIETIDGKKTLVFDRSNNIVYMGENSYIVEAGKEYTFSFYAKASANLNLSHVYISSNNSNYIPNTLITTEWKRYSFTFIPKASEKINPHMYPSIKQADGTYKKFYLTEWKLEEGNKATTWTPAPEEVDTRIAKSESEILQTKDAIALKVSKDYLLGLEMSDNLVNVESGWEVGAVTLTPNKPQDKVNSTTRLRYFDNPIEVTGGAIYSLVNDNLDYAIAIHELDSDMNFVVDGGWLTNRQHKRTMSKNTKYIRFFARATATLSSTKVTLDDISKTKFSLVKGDIYQSWKPSQKDVDTKLLKTEAKIDIQADQISSKVSQVEVNKSISDISIGGRNLFKGSKTIEMYSNNNATAPIDKKVMNDEKEPYIRHIPLISIMSLYRHLHMYETIEKLEKGKTYTISLMARAVDADVNVSIFVRDSTSPAYESSTVVNPVPMGVWSNVSVTFTPNRDILSYHIVLRTNKSTTLDLKLFKLEEGNKATAWTPAPEEIDEKIAKNETEILQTKDDIALKASKSEIDTLTGRVSSTEASLKVQADQISSKVTSSNVTDLINSNAKVKDTRGTNEDPLYYWANYPARSVEEFKSCKTIGVEASGFCLLTTSSKWADPSGGKIVQTATSDYASYERKSKSNTEWEEWVQLVDKKVMGTYVTQTIDSWGVDVVRNGNVISKINASTEGVTIAGDKVNIRGNTTFTNAETDILKAKKIAMLTGSKLIYEDVKFEVGKNGVMAYNNTGNGNVIVSRITKPSDCPTKSTHALEIKTIGSASPSNGGIYQPVMSRADAKFLVKYLAKLPIGYFFQANTNSMGSGYTDEWLTPTVGTGRYTEYIRLVSCGTTGTFNNGGHLSVVGEVATVEAPLIWYLGSIEAYDLSDYQALPTSAQDTIDIADTWRTTGKTTIDGGKIETDSITSAQIVAGSITSDELNAKAIDGMVVTGATFRTSAYASSNGGVVIDSNGISGYNTSGTKKFSLGATGTLSATDVIISGTLNAGASSTFAGNVETEKDIIIGNNIYLRKGASFADAQKRLYFDYIDTSNTGYTWIQGNRLGMTLNANNITLSTGVAGTSIDLEGAVRTSLSKSFNFNRTSGYAFEVNYRPALFTNGLVVNGGTVNFTGATVTGVTATFG